MACGRKRDCCGNHDRNLDCLGCGDRNQVAKVECDKGEVRSAYYVKPANTMLVFGWCIERLQLRFESPARGSSRFERSPAREHYRRFVRRWLYASNNIGEILAWDLTNANAAPKTIPCELRSSQIRFVEGGKLASISKSSPSLSFTPSNASLNAVAKVSGTIEDFAILPDDSYIAVADGTSVIQLADWWLMDPSN